MTGEGVRVDITGSNRGLGGGPASRILAGTVSDLTGKGVFGLLRSVLTLLSPELGVSDIRLNISATSDFFGLFLTGGGFFLTSGGFFGAEGCSLAFSKMFATS